MFLGIEIGGTKLQLGIGPGDGTLAALWRGTVDIAAGPDGIRRQITAAVPPLLAKAGLTNSQVRGVGIGFGGPVDDATRTVIKSHQIEGWDNFPLADWITDLTGWPAVLGNDAGVAGLAEALYGAGRGLSPIFYITIGSGIGGGLIINGEIYRGCGRGAAEIGHLRLFYGYLGLRDFEVNNIESVASGWGIERKARIIAKLKSSRSDALIALAGGDANQITLQHIAEAIKRGDSFARNLLERPFFHLSRAICHVIALLCPRQVIIGGGVSQLGDDLFFEPMRKMVAERVFKPFADCYEIVPAALGEEVVVHGAIALASHNNQANSAEGQ